MTPPNHLGHVSGKGKGKFVSVQAMKKEYGYRSASSLDDSYWWDYALAALQGSKELPEYTEKILGDLLDLDILKKINICCFCRESNPGPYSLWPSLYTVSLIVDVVSEDVKRVYLLGHRTCIYIRI